MCLHHVRVSCLGRVILSGSQCGHADPTGYCPRIMQNTYMPAAHGIRAYESITGTATYPRRRVRAIFFPHPYPLHSNSLENGA